MTIFNLDAKPWKWTQDIRPLLEAYADYVALLEKAGADSAGIAYVHGYKPKQEDVDKGIELRARIAKMKSLIG